MRLVVVSLITPYKENVRGTSALAYHLLRGYLSQASKERLDNSQQVIVYSFNANGLSKDKIATVENELGASIRILSLPRWYRWLFKLHLLFLRIFLKYPFVNYIKLPKQIVDEIKSLAPDLIWVNNEELSRVVNQFQGFRCIQIGPDVESLYYYRMMGRKFVMNSVIDYWKCSMMYRKYARLERNLCDNDNFTYYAVGEADIEHLKQLNPKVNCRFLRHPHYYVKNIVDDIHFHHPKIKLLIAGRYDLYMKQLADELMPILASHSTELKEHYEIAFLGKGWEKHIELLRQSGFEINHIIYAPDYIEEIIKYDIQLTPICIGTGTKGKVLDALANGLLVLGTPFALENIAVEHGKSCIEWRNASEVPSILVDILDNIEKYEKIAIDGRNAVLANHNPVDISRFLLSS